MACAVIKPPLCKHPQNNGYKKECCDTHVPLLKIKLLVTAYEKTQQ